MYDELKRGSQSTDASFANKRSVYYSTSDNYSQLLELETLTNSINADNQDFGSILGTEVEGSEKSEMDASTTAKSPAKSSLKKYFYSISKDNRGMV